MLKEKEYYQTLIENSVLFFQNIPPESVLYKKELLKLIENIYHYLTLVSEQNQQYSVEIVETVKECVKNYDDSKGKFLHYFNFCLKKKKTKIRMYYYIIHPKLKKEKRAREVKPRFPL